MKKPIIFIASLLLLASCGNSSSSPSEPPVTPKSLEKIEVTQYKDSYFVNEAFVTPTVIASFSDSSNENVSSKATYIGFDSSTPTNEQEITVTYLTKTTSFTVSINKKATSLTLSNKVTEFELGDDFVRCSVEATFNDGSSEDVTNDAIFSGYNPDQIGEQTITVSYGGVTETYVVTVVKTTDSKTITGMAKTIDKSSDLTKLEPVVFENMFKVSFGNDGGSTNPIVNNDNGWSVRLYQNNTITIDCPLYTLYKIEIPTVKLTGSMTSEEGEVTVKGSTIIWSGSSNKVTLKSTAHTWFDSFTATYKNGESGEEDLPGVSTISEVRAKASTMHYVPNNVGWYLSNVGVTLEIEAIDTIDSKDESSKAGYDPNVRGKTVARDETGYIILGSGTSDESPISLYARAKYYIRRENKPTTYVVHGHIAFLNGNVEVKVDSYTFDESIEITTPISELSAKEISSQSEFVDETLEVTSSQSGYAVKDIVTFKGLTYLTKYNEAGSYLFTDQSGNIVPVYSLEDKDRSYLVKGLCYDIIGLESQYGFRPSFRILKVNKSELSPVDFDFENNVTTVTDLSSLNQIKEGTSSYPRSQLTIYKADMYVSSYENNAEKFALNTKYYKSGSYYYAARNDTDIVTQKAIGVFNSKDCYDHQTFADFDISSISDESLLTDKKVTIYFGLALTGTAYRTSYWRVNVFEDLVYTLDYYKSKEASMTFDSSREDTTVNQVQGEYQSWSNSNNSLVVRNDKTSESTTTTVFNYLKINDGTKLTITFDKPIIGFTLFTGTYSYIYSLDDDFIDNVFAYKQFSSYTTFILKEKSTEVVIASLGVGSNHNNSYLKVESITVNYLEA